MWVCIYAATNNSFSSGKSSVCVFICTLSRAKSPGDVRKRSIPNITGAVGRKNGVQQGGQCFSDCGLQNIQMVGALYATAAGKQFDLGNSTVSDETASVVNIDASRISSIYSNETSVQPPALQILIIIKI